jgi:hypothetical protein
LKISPKIVSFACFVAGLALIGSSLMLPWAELRIAGFFSPGKKDGHEILWVLPAALMALAIVVTVIWRMRRRQTQAGIGYALLGIIGILSVLYVQSQIERRDVLLLGTGDLKIIEGRPLFGLLVLLVGCALLTAAGFTEMMQVPFKKHRKGRR